MTVPEAESHTRSTRQISFLGTGRYQQTTYVLDGEQVSTCYVAEAIARVVRPAEAHLVATAGAWDAHGEAIRQALTEAGVGAVFHVAIPDGSVPAEQWVQFEAVRSLLERADGIDSVVLDITHGWRAQPFVAGAVVTYHRATTLDPAPLRVLYGAYTPATELSPVWDLTAFLDVVEWGQGLRTLLQTGRAKQVVDATLVVASERSRAWVAQGKSGPQPRLRQLAVALRAFSDDLTTVRTGDLLGPSGSAKRLVDAVPPAEAEVQKDLPPLFPLLRRVTELAQPFTAGAVGDDGESVLAALARLYMRLERPLEAITVAREARISRYAGAVGRRIGTARSPVDSKAFKAARSAAEDAWYTRDPNARELAEVRNTLDHAAFQARPLPAGTVLDRVRIEVDRLEGPPAPAAAGSESAVFVNLSHHPITGWDGNQRVAAVALAPVLVDLPFPQVPPDLESVDELVRSVLGQLPDGATHAMVQGESVLSVALIVSLQKRGVTCVAATTERTEAGRFQFVRFRVYPDLGRG